LTTNDHTREPDWGATPAARPLGLASEADIVRYFEAALECADGAAGAHCAHERMMRGAMPQQIEADLEQLWRAASASVPDWLPMRYVSWLPTVYEVAARFTPRKRGRAHVYLVLLDFSDRAGADFGVYVGMSSYLPAQRFDQHKAGIRSAGVVLKRGVELLAGPTLHLRYIARADAARIERELALALADAGVAVAGGH
jgi:hypothetical protein